MISRLNSKRICILEKQQQQQLSNRGVCCMCNHVWDEKYYSMHIEEQQMSYKWVYNEKGRARNTHKFL